MNIEKWLASIMWALLLAALVFTSVQAFSLLVELDVYNTAIATFNVSRGITEEGVEASEIVALLLSVLASLFLVLAWLNFANLSTYFLRSMALNESPFASFLILPVEADEENLSLATGTTVSSVVRFLGFAWGTLLVSPALIKVIIELLGDPK